MMDRQTYRQPWEKQCLLKMVVCLWGGGGGRERHNNAIQHGNNCLKLLVQ